jgi:hypothetical protein
LNGHGSTFFEKTNAGVADILNIVAWRIIGTHTHTLGNVSSFKQQQSATAFVLMIHIAVHTAAI